MATERDLIQRMARELDLYRQLLRDDCTSTHPFADEARALLSQPEPEGPTESDLSELFYRHVGEGSEVGFENAIAEALARWGRPAVEPEPEALTDEEILKISDQFDIDGIEDVTKGMPFDTFWDSYQPQQLIAFARAIIAGDRARWGRTTTTHFPSIAHDLPKFNLYFLHKQMGIIIKKFWL